MYFHRISNQSSEYEFINSCVANLQDVNLCRDGKPCFKKQKPGFAMRNLTLI